MVLRRTHGQRCYRGQGPGRVRVVTGFDGRVFDLEECVWDDIEDALPGQECRDGGSRFRLRDARSCEVVCVSLRLWNQSLRNPKQTSV